MAQLHDATIAVIEGALDTALKIDPAFTTTSKREILEYLKTGEIGRPPAAKPEIVSRPVTRNELAKRIGVKSLRTIDYHARKGRLQRVYFKGSRRCLGFTAESVNAFLQGKEVR